MSSHDTLIAPAWRARTESLASPGPPRRGAPHDATRRPAPHDAVLGGRYVLVERLGAGGFGVVWRAHDTHLDREVAVKAIPLPAGESRARAAREALATARLAHPAIVALFEAREEGEDFYLVSELVDGHTLAASLERGELHDGEILEIGLALADALLHAHARGVIHRDLKPHNVLVPADPARASASAKLADFGGALLAGEEGITRTGDVLGTLAYMAPEQLEGVEVDERADLYSLALVLYEALTGVNPVRGPTPAATARRVGSVLPPLESRRRDLPHELARALDRALHPDPAARGSLPELREALAHTLPGHPGAAHRGEPGASGWLTLPRVCWLAGALSLCVWLLTTARPGLALLLLCAMAPLVVAVRRPGPGWLLGALAPLLGLAGLAGAFPALAGQATHWRSRALLGACGYWWLRLAELPLDSHVGSLWLGVPAAPSSSTAWEASLAAAAHALAPLLGVALLLGAVLWAMAAVLLPWVVRGRAAGLDALAAAVWAGALAASAPVLDRGAPLVAAGTAGLQPGRVPLHAAVLGAAVGAVFAVAARALRGPV